MLYKDLVKLILDTVGTPKLIKMTDFGSIIEFVTHNKVFPLAFLEPSVISYEPNYTNYRFKLFLLDQVQKSKYNELEILSQMEQIAHDFIVMMSVAGIEYVFNVQYASSSSEIELQSQDEGLAGLVLTFVIRKEHNNTRDCYQEDITT